MSSCVKCSRKGNLVSGGGEIRVWVFEKPTMYGLGLRFRAEGFGPAYSTSPRNLSSKSAVSFEFRALS